MQALHDAPKLMYKIGKVENQMLSHRQNTRKLRKEATQAVCSTLHLRPVRYALREKCARTMVAIYARHKLNCPSFICNHCCGKYFSRTSSVEFRLPLYDYPTKRPHCIPDHMYVPNCQVMLATLEQQITLLLLPERLQHTPSTHTAYQRWLLTQ